MFRLGAVFCFVLVVARAAVGQDLPRLTVAPGSATMLVGESRTFRAVGKDGRPRHNVQWSVSPEHAVSLSVEADEATIEAKEPSAVVILSASSEGDSAQATLEIRSGDKLTPGTQIWSVPAMPGCKNRQISQAVPTANGPDLYVEEDCPQGRLVRALTADGREMWRTLLPDGQSRMPIVSSNQSAAPSTSAPHLRLHANSICDAITPGMAKEKVGALVDARKLRLEEAQRQSDAWTFEEEGSSCTIFFDPNTHAVARKRKTIVTE